MLRYALEHPDEQQVLQRYADHGMGTPKWAIDAPEVPLGAQIILDAYFELDTCRPIGWGAGYIPWTAINDYCHERGIKDPAERHEFEYLIRRMDREHLKYNKEQQDKK